MIYAALSEAAEKGELLRQRFPEAILRAKCQAISPANAFWNAVGFGIAYEEDGFRVWEQDPH